ncbi:hypothetical protein I305_01339 [Cryptococcus gattii E566]|uniref:Uncharacterized protein n=2 Tax=Cryptococcus gattii TaxID=37769 RepID=E6QZP4_CRYGW|nr:Hypothetical Protein CGB_B0071C [Cryptococcus gattii WM276]ADV20127.1 Hypothetical Protein CGB_B0071C [Cryptococcus gattii WM276]KIR77356.1 hypothetical protein I306_05550 [Cryptococcus gattii EJB2]KIY36478.1 hypothetical protein I305_01339 [Cryptococcus gattii E566]KJE05871.1 hypothetical protein I311_00007 [Cryptococcus gattii NT-10]
MWLLEIRALRDTGGPSIPVALKISHLAYCLEQEDLGSGGGLSNICVYPSFDQRDY